MILFISPFRLDPRLVNRVRLLSEHFSKIVLIEGVRNSEILEPFKASSKGRLSVRPYKEVAAALSHVKEGDVIYISAVRGLVENYRMLRKLKSSIKARVVLEIADLVHRGSFLIDLFLNKSIYVMIRGLVDLLITTSSGFSQFFSRISSVVVENIPNESVLRKLARLRYEYPSEKNVTFLGGFWYPEQLFMLMKYAELRPNVRVDLHGGPQHLLTRFMHKMSTSTYPINVEYRGTYNYEEEIFDIYKKATAIYSVYDARILNVRLALPNKLYESIAAGRPIITAEDTFLEKVVKEKRLGSSVPYRCKDLDSFVNAMDEALAITSPFMCSEEDNQELFHRKSKQEEELVNALNEIA